MRWLQPAGSADLDPRSSPAVVDSPLPTEAKEPVETAALVEGWALQTDAQEAQAAQVEALPCAMTSTADKGNKMPLAATLAWWQSLEAALEVAEARVEEAAAVAAPGTNTSYLSLY